MKRQIIFLSCIFSFAFNHSAYAADKKESNPDDSRQITHFSQFPDNNPTATASLIYIPLDHTKPNFILPDNAKVFFNEGRVVYLVPFWLTRDKFVVSGDDATKATKGLWDIRKKIKDDSPELPELSDTTPENQGESYILEQL